ncbi:MAG: hypothetical protein IJ493_12840 [Clostridia bacterium]|nr:hypothetical protein [Clostridia bacterium]
MEPKKSPIPEIPGNQPLHPRADAAVRAYRATGGQTDMLGSYTGITHNLTADGLMRADSPMAYNGSPANGAPELVPPDVDPVQDADDL